MKLEELQAYVVLRGSLLSAEDKKRVLVEAGAEAGSELTMARVSAAVRMLGAGFFQEYTGGKRTKLKTYDQEAFITEETDSTSQDIFATQEDDHEEEYLEALLQEGDDDAVLITEYETAINDTIQDDPELATALNAYADARRRLSERPSEIVGFGRSKAMGSLVEKAKDTAKEKGRVVVERYKIGSFHQDAESATRWVTGRPSAQNASLRVRHPLVQQQALQCPKVYIHM